MMIDVLCLSEGWQAVNERTALLASNAELLAVLVSAMSAIPNPDDVENYPEGISEYQAFWNREMYKKYRAAIASAAKGGSK